MQIALVCLVSFLRQADSHGRLLNPPARSSAWRESPSLFPAYYNDMVGWGGACGAVALACVSFCSCLEGNVLRRLWRAVEPEQSVLFGRLLLLKPFSDGSNLQPDGKCGICGEDWSGQKQFEKGGSMYRGISVRTYKQGQIIDVYVEVRAV